MSIWLAPLLAQVITFSAGDRTEFRTRVRPDATRHDIETRPNVQMVAAGHRTRWMLGYMPMASRLAIGTDADQTLLMQMGRGELGFRWRRTGLLLSQDVSYGRSNYQALALAASTGSSQPTAPIRPPTGLPTQLGYLDQTLVTGSSNTTLRIDHAISRRLRSETSAGYSLTGGLDSQSQRVIPILRGPLASAGLRYLVTRTDDASTILSGYLMDSSAGRQPWMTMAEERWDRRWSPLWSSRLSAGVASANNARALTIAAASATLTTPIGRSRLQATADARLAPLIDPRTALVDERMLAEGGVTWTRGPLSLLGRCSATRSTHPSRPAGIVGYGWAAGMTYAFSDEWSLDAGVRGTRLTVAGSNLLPTEWAGYTAVRYATTFPSL